MVDSEVDSAGSTDNLKQYEGPQGLVTRWLKEIELVRSSKAQQNFERVGERVVKKYKNSKQMDLADQNGNVPPGEMFNVLWSNVQVLAPALYSRMPQPVAERVFKDHDPVGRLAAEVAERAAHYQLLSQQDRFNYAIKAAVQDRLLPGRGQVWLQYKADFEPMTDEEGRQITENGQPVKQVKPNSERVEVCPVNWIDYLESPARNQYEIRWRSKDIYLTRQELIAEFGEEVGRKVALDKGQPKRGKKYTNEEAEFLLQATVHVIYDITSKQVLWISPGYKEAPLKQLKDPLKIKDFWCCPIPLLATTTTDSTYPVADYVIYESMADELNYTSKRISAMIDSIKLVGAMASQYSKDIKNILALPDGNCWPIDNWGAFAEKGGLKGMIDWIPFDQCVAALEPLMAYQASLKAQIDEITSMPDIVRGSSDPNDPVYTQQQKSHWTVIKLMEKQQDVQRFCREIISKMAQIIFEPGFFSDETIALMAGVAQMPPDKQEMFPQALALLRDDRLNTFRIDIETDSTIAIDEDQVMARWMQYLEAIQSIFSTVANVQQYRPELMSPMIESALGAVRTLRTGRSVEGSWEKALENIEAADKEARENPQPPPPDPQLLRAQNESQKNQQEYELKSRELALKEFIEPQKLMLESQKNEGTIAIGHEKNMIDAQEQLTRGQIDKIIADMDVFQEQLKNQLETVRVQIEKERLEFDKQAKILEVKEKIMEEQRLAGDQHLELKRMDLEHKAAMKDSGGGGDEKPKKSEKSSPMAISINLPDTKAKKPRKRKVTPIRDKDGNIVSAEFEDVEDS